MSWKPPVSRLRDGGFLRLYTSAVVAAILSFFGPSVADAATTVSVEKNYYSYTDIVAGQAPRLTAQGATVSLEDGGFNKAVHLEWGGFAGPARTMHMVNMSIALEKPMTANTLVGVGVGFAQCDFSGPFAVPTMKSFVGDLYGKVKLIKFGNSSLGSFVSARLVNPTPFGDTLVYKFGLEINVVK